MFKYCKRQQRTVVTIVSVSVTESIRLQIDFRSYYVIYVKVFKTM